MIWRVDLHVHTAFSNDSRTSFEKIVTTCTKKRFNALAIVDHNTIEGALKFKDAAPQDLMVIVGEEIKTASGEIIGLFLSELIEQGLSARETIDKIREQNGVAIVPHPFDSYRKSCLDRSVLSDIVLKVDGIETYNSRNLNEDANIQAANFAKEFDLLNTAGSDAHLPSEIGNAYMEMMPFDSAESFLASAKTAKIVGRKSGIIPHVVTKFVKITRKKKF